MQIQDRLVKPATLISAVFLFVAFCNAQRPANKPVSGPMLNQGIVALNTPQFVLKLVRSSQTVAALQPRGADGFDFTPGDLLTARSTDGYYHLGDLDLRLRVGSAGPWQGYSTALHRAPVTMLRASGNILAAADLAPTLPAEIPLKITRAWALENGKLVLRFILTNRAKKPVEIGALGIPMIFNNILTGRTLAQAHTMCSFYDPYIGEDAGYLRVTRLNGHGPALLVVPDEHTPFEAYKPILNPDRHSRASDPTLFRDLTPRGITFEGFYDWMVHSGALQQTEWKSAQPWNVVTTFTLQPGQSRTYALRFLLSDSIEGIENTLVANGRPIAVGVPGYILPTDIVAHLFLKYAQPVKSIAEDPAGAIFIRKTTPTHGGWSNYVVEGKTWGRARVSIMYNNGLVQTINYRVIKPESQAVADLGHFIATKQWFTNFADPFHRAPSAITFDRQANQQVTQDSRVWIAGLSDEAGAGSWLTLAMKQLGEPNQEEVSKLEQFIDGVLWGQIQYKDGPEKYGVRKSLFYYEPAQFPRGFYRSDLDWKSWTSWNQKASEAVDRSFNYPHVASVYWVMYRLARNHPGLVTNHSWSWYLDHAYQTSVAMTKFAPYYTQFGQMEGDVFVCILEDLKREGMIMQAAYLEAAMRSRADRWKTEEYPFASEMPWDSTGQEEVYAWMTYFGYRPKAVTTIDAILGYDPAIPNWGYNGSARRYWDFIYGGKIRRLERQLHHYGSGINAMPLLTEYRSRPSDLYLLRVGYGGIMGELSNIDQDGFASAAFHAFPDMLAFDPYSGDYGSGFWGFAITTATYVAHNSALSWLCFGGNLEFDAADVTITPLDAFRNRIYFAPLRLWLTLDSGKFNRVTYDSKTGTVRLTLDPENQFTPVARLRIQQPMQISDTRPYVPAKPFPMERGAYVVQLGRGTTEIVLRLRPTEPN